MVITKDLKAELLERLKTQAQVVVPASEAEYLELAPHFPFKIEYHQSEIHAMGLSSYIHELIIATIVTILNNLFADKEEYTVLGSNAGVQIPKFEGGYYMPDITVVKGEPQFKSNSTAIITNPYLVVEVQSPGTDVFDTESKLPEYKHIESLQQIVFVSQKQVRVSSYLRTQTPRVWLNEDFDALDQTMLIDNQPVSLAAIYKKVKF